MRNISPDAGDIVRAGRIDDPIFLGSEAKRMVTELVEAEDRGRGDKLEAIAHRLQVKYGVSARIVLQCWHRPPREMLVSRWMAVFRAHCLWLSRQAERAYETRRGAVAVERHPVLCRLADAVAGHMEHPRAGGRHQ